MSRRGIEVRPVTAERWPDLVSLFGPSGVSGCWCMWWRQTSAEFDRKHGEPNRRAMRRIVAADRVPGLLAYIGDEPAGWVSIAPRAEFGRLERSPSLARVDDEEDVWSIVCFYIARGRRRQGVGTALLEAAVKHAGAQGARIVEGYPVATPGGKVPGSSIYTGVPSMFEAAGFREVARRKPKRPIMRRKVSSRRS